MPDNNNQETSEVSSSVSMDKTNYHSEMIDNPQANTNSWQKWLFFVGLSFTLIIFFVFMYITNVQMENLQNSINGSPDLKDSMLISASHSDKNISLMLLENQTIKKRYHNAGVILKAQIYIKFLGFLTGMILSILGSIFILGKFREYPTTVNTKGGEASNAFSLQLQSTSPGIILAIIGATIMLVTILKQTEVGVTDAPIYINSYKYSPDIKSPSEATMNDLNENVENKK